MDERMRLVIGLRDCWEIFTECSWEKKVSVSVVAFRCVFNDGTVLFGEN